MCHHSRTAPPGRGFTVVELLVVVAIIAVLVGILLPAVNSAREAGRRITCANNLRQLATSVALHHDAHQHFPTDGWGFLWIGDPDSGYGVRQPGGWLYNILPFIEAAQLRDIGRLQRPEEKRRALRTLLAVPISGLYCPSRRDTSVYPFGAIRFPLRNVENPLVAAKNDYAINGGDTKVNAGTGPNDMNQSTMRDYEWPELREITGISFVRSRFRMRDVQRGTSKTYMLGEKYVPVATYRSGESSGDDQTSFVGDDADIRRWTLSRPVHDRQGGSHDDFGSAHPSGCHFTFCDGSTRLVAYDVDMAIHRASGNRTAGP